MNAFTLTKWYLDVVDDAGRSAIAYWAAINWGPLDVCWQGLSLHEAGARAVHRASHAKNRPPVRSNGRITWQSDALDCRIRCDDWWLPFEARLLETDRGGLDWRCEMPGGDVLFDAGGGCQLRGTGYAERLVLTLLPWRLPISELHWGRWISPTTRRSIVWIDWRGVRPMTLVLDGGARQAQPIVRDTTISFGGNLAEGGQVLQLDRPETLHARRLPEILRGLRPLARRLPAAWRAVEDRKMRSRGSLGQGSAAPDAGWAIHETVRFP